MSEKRFVAEPARIGIRVIVDGRCNGVREKIEAPTFILANLAKELIEKNLRHADGTPVECVVSSTAVGGVREAALVSDEFRRQNVGAVISVSRAFAYAAEIMEYDSRLPQAIWGFSGSERPGSIYLAAASAVAEQKGIPVFKIYGRDVQDADDLSIPEDVEEKLLLFAKCATALLDMKGKSYLSIGGTCMGIGGSIVDQDFFRCYLGMRSEAVDMSELMRRIQLEIYDHAEYARAMAWVKKNCHEMKDPNPEEIQHTPEQKAKDWEIVVKMALIMRDLMVGNPVLKKMGYPEEAQGHNAIVGGFQGQRQWTDFMPNGDFAEAILNSSFDWDGTRQPYPLATENDSLNGVTMMMGNLLTGTAQIFCDVRAYWSKEAIEKSTQAQVPPCAENGFIYLTNSGAAALDGTMEAQKDGCPAMKPFWELTPTEVQACLEHTSWGAGKLATFRGGGFSSSYLSHGGVPMTMLRLNIMKGLGPVLQIAEGETIELTQEIEQKLIARTDPTWPKTFFVPRLMGNGAFRSVYELMNHWGANHCSLCYGHVGREFITLASMLRIPVCMHNLPETDLFRPAAWTGHGADEPIGADFRACKTYGPLYAQCCK